MSTKYAEYLICKQRGHEQASAVLIGTHSYSICKFCGTQYWTELSKHENNVPTPPAADREAGKDE